MQSREFLLRVQDILAEIVVVEQTIAGLSFETFSQSQQALRVVLYSLAVIGEAVASAIAEIIQQMPDTVDHQGGPSA